MVEGRKTDQVREERPVIEELIGSLTPDQAAVCRH